MRSVSQAVALTAALVLLGSLTHAARAETACEHLKSLRLPDTKITVAESHAAAVEAFDFQGPPGMQAGPVKASMPAYCRVTGSIRPTPDSDIRFELWMPAQDWNHRYEQVGNGGLAGSILRTTMIGPLQQHWAVAATDDGHVGSGMSDGRWALGHPEKIVDFGYRAVHLTAQRSQEIVRAYYGAKAAHRYFIGCSDGGRESLMEAQRYPEDFDGFVAGAPAQDVPAITIGQVYRAQVVQALGADRLNDAQMHFVIGRELARCDALDGLKDGLIADPRRCNFDPKELICGAPAASDGCLSAAQAEAIRKIYDGPHDSATGTPLAYGYADTVGTEVPALRSGAPPDAMGQQFFGNLVYGNPSLDPATLDLTRAGHDAHERLGPMLDPSSSDLHGIKDSGKKIIQYHGWADPAIPAQLSLAYFQSVQTALGDTQEFYRLFMVPGMGHCGGGVGPSWLMGNGVSHDSQHDVVLALSHWVEDGVAPDQIIATEFDRPVSDPLNGPPAGTPIRSERPICAYPKTAQYTGHGSTTAAESFRCGS